MSCQNNFASNEYAKKSETERMKDFHSESKSERNARGHVKISTNGVNNKCSEHRSDNKR